MSEDDIFADLRCHFTWDTLKPENLGSSLEISIEDLQEHMKYTKDKTEVESCNLMGYFWTLSRNYSQAREHFVEALNWCVTDDQKLVAMANLAFLSRIEESMLTSTLTSFSKITSSERVEEIHGILNGRDLDSLPEVLAEKAFSIAKSGYTEQRFKEAYKCINAAIEAGNPDCVCYKLTKAIIMQRLFQDHIVPGCEDRQEVQEIKNTWTAIIESLEDLESNSLMAYAITESAIFYQRINWKIDTLEQLVDKAQELASSNEIVLRNIAFYYLLSSKHNASVLEKAEYIVEMLLRQQSRPTKALYLKGLVFTDKYRFAPRVEKECHFNEAKNCLYFSWEQRSKMDVVPALKLVELFQFKYEDTEDEEILLEMESFFREIFHDIRKLHDYSKALVHKNYSKFLMEYSHKLCQLHQQKAFQYRNHGNLLSM